jgi:protein TonB
VLLLGGLILGLAAPAVLQRASSALVSLDMTQTPPPPRPHRNAGGPAGRKAKTAPAEAPSPPLPVAAPTIAASHAGEGTSPAGGDAAAGSGPGAGGSGSGQGSGDDEGDDPAWIAGRISDHDYPGSAREAREQGTTRTRIAVDAGGRPTGCSVLHTSGSPTLDATTCRLVLKRFRFSPARDAAGQPVAGEIDYDQEWSITGYMGE